MILKRGITFVLLILIVIIVYAGTSGNDWEVINPDADISVAWTPVTAGNNYDEVDEGIENADDDTSYVKVERSSLGTTTATDWIRLAKKYHKRHIAQYLTPKFIKHLAIVNGDERTA